MAKEVAFPKGCNASTIIESKDLVHRTDPFGHSLLHWAIQNYNIELCREIIVAGCIIDQMSSFGYTPLMLASVNGGIEIAKLLLDYGADPLLTSNYGADALSMACAGGHIEIVQLLTDCTGKPVENEDSSWPQHPVIISAACKSICIQFLYEHDSDCIHEINKLTGMNALMLAEAGRFEEIVSWLLLHGAKKNPAVKQFTPLLTPVQNIFLFPSSPQNSPYNSQCSPGFSMNSTAFPFPPVLPHNTNHYPMHFENSDHLSVPSIALSLPHGHPLTPNICISPLKKASSPFQKQSASKDERKNNSLYSWFKKLKRKRSKSLENLTKLKRKTSSGTEHNNILDYILSTANLSEYKSCFIDQEVTFKTFLTLNEDELIEVGIKRPKVRKKFLTLIQHYKRIFYSQI